jgi:hypothetical protein
MQQKSKESLTKADLIANGGVAPHQLPDDLRQCLEVIEDSIIPVMLSSAKVSGNGTTSSILL